jgi:hypothetical protein
MLSFFKYFLSVYYCILYFTIVQNQVTQIYLRLFLWHSFVELSLAASKARAAKVAKVSEVVAIANV